MRKLSLAVIGAIILMLALVPLVVSRPTEIYFNQYEINQYDLELDRVDVLNRFAIYLSRYSTYLRAIFYSQSERPNPDEPNSVIRYILSRTPLFSMVLPSEGYFYFKVPAEEGEIAGNLRFNDLDLGVLGYGYYPVQGAVQEGSRSRFAAGYLHHDKDLTLRQITDRLWLVNFEGYHTLFLTPRVITEAPAEFRLEEREEYVSWVLDESGIPFHLVFSKGSSSFYYILDESNELPEALRQEDELFVGEKSRFVYIQEIDNKRKILVGIHDHSALENSYFDGPFDQVPAKLPLRELLFEAYPYLKLGGVDPYGFLCLNRSLRAAVTPYTRYSDLKEIKQNRDICQQNAKNNSSFRHCMSFDEKQGFHLESDAFDGEANLLKGEPRSCEYELVID